MCSQLQRSQASATADRRVFDIRLSFAEGDIIKTITIVDPSTTSEDVLAWMGSEVLNNQRPISKGSRDYRDIRCADVPCGIVVEKRNGQLVKVLRFQQSDGFMLADSFEVLEAEPEDDDNDND